jgi:hypothetical protein
MLLPNPENAVIDMRKLEEYCLSPTHPVGRHKARVFRAALGWTAHDASTLRELILRGVCAQDAITTTADEYGQRYQVDVPATTPTGSATIRTAWMIRKGEDFPRLTTCYVLGS